VTLFEDKSALLVDYNLKLKQALTLPERWVPNIPPGKLYQYVLGAEGVFLHAEREGLELSLQVAATWALGPLIRGLDYIEEFVNCEYPRIPLPAVAYMLERARAAKDAEGRPVEILYHLYFDQGAHKWQLVLPEQEQSATSCRPVGSALGPGGSYERAFIEVHSHHSMRAFFSGTDDADEQGFRVYGVLGTIFERPTLRLRIGVYGQFFEVSASYFFELGMPGQPAIVEDAYAQDTKELEKKAESFKKAEIEAEAEAEMEADRE
jgi:PRTRC genetic system protein A